MVNPRLSRITLVTLMVLALSACSGLTSHPDRVNRHAQTVALPTSWQETLPQNPVLLSDQLLDLIDNPQLTRLVQQTLAANYDLRQTALRLREQQLLARQTDAARKPELNLNLNSQRVKDSIITNTQTLSLDLSWEVDVWGRLADQSRAAEATTQARVLDYQAARNSLAARTIQRWIDISLREQVIRAEQQWLQSLQSTEEVITERYRSGLSGSNGLADLEAARTATARIRASLAAREQVQRNAYRQLAALQGIAGQIDLPNPQLRPDIENPPLRLPAEMIAHRPDLQSAYQQILAADAQAAVAQKQLLPSFSLSASLSQTRPDLNDLLSGSNAWSLLGRLTAPLFNAGRLKAGAEIAGLQAERSYLAYQQTLLNALNEVEASLGQEAALAQQQLHLKAALQHSEASLAHYQARYRDGLNTILDLLNAKQSAFDARIQLLQTQQARLTNRITLGLALGMGV
ncbi:efflux transporter outer membrane subunit [Pontibacterium sinense]|nr:TolC family protein [Pontibacterium sinense]